MNPVVRFVDAVNRGDLPAVEAVLHPDFEMVVPQHPARGFKGRDQEVKNMRLLVESHPEGRIEIQRMVEDLPEIWVETTYRTGDLEMAAVIIFHIDPETDTIVRGRYYSGPVERGGPDIDEWMERLTPGS
jgi:ketosteroid isomerase-like protein